MKYNIPPAFARQGPRIQWLLLDVDGVMSDGALYFSERGEALKRFYVHDGLGLRLLQSVGLKIAILSARDSAITQARAQDLKIDVVIQGALNKELAFKHFLEAQKVAPEHCAFIGDDIIDLAVLKAVGLSCCPANAHPVVVPHVDYQTRCEGGAGAIREVCDLLLKVQGRWAEVLARYGVKEEAGDE